VVPVTGGETATCYLCKEEVRGGTHGWTYADIERREGPLHPICVGCAGKRYASWLVKDGHGEGREVVDELHTPGEVLRLARPRLPVGPVRGTGCALASAIASHLARGLSLAAAVTLAGEQLAAVLAALGPAGDDGLPRLLPLALWPRAAAAGG
jgi:hypothetical protein